MHKKSVLYESTVKRTLQIRHTVTGTWLIGQVVKTSPSHGEDRGSTPLLAILYYSVLERVGRNVHSFVVRHNTGGLTGGDSLRFKIMERR